VGKAPFLLVTKASTGTFRQRSKGKWEICPLSLVTLLRQHRVDQEVRTLMLGRSLTEDDFVFSQADGSPLNPNTVTHTFAKVAARAGLPHIRLHDLRYIHATSIFIFVVRFSSNLWIRGTSEAGSIGLLT